MANERTLKSEGEEVEESGEAKRGQRGPLGQRRIKKETARRRRQESTDGKSVRFPQLKAQEVTGICLRFRRRFDTDQRIWPEAHA